MTEAAPPADYDERVIKDSVLTILLQGSFVDRTLWAEYENTKSFLAVVPIERRRSRRTW